MARLVGDYLVDPFDHLQLAANTFLPGLQRKPAGQHAVNAGQVGIAHQLQYVLGSLEQGVGFDFQLTERPSRSAV